jgi:hypothetical protein
MGTINYRASDIVTLGYNVPSELDYSKEEIEEIFEYGYEDIQDYINDDTEDVYSVCKEIVDRYNFYWFKVELKSGYYDGFYLDLNTDYMIKYLEQDDKDEIKEEIKDLKKMLYELLSYMNVCSPWWCTTWYNFEEGTKKIDEAIKKLNNELAN